MSPGALRFRRSLVAVVAASVAGAVLVHPGPVVSAAGNFTSPVTLPKSDGYGEPSLAVDSAGRLFATAPQSIGNITGTGSPVWTSTNQGATWGQPVGPAGDPVSGGDTDLAVDSADNVFQTDLWLGNSAMALSTDHGQSFIANEYGHVQPGDDRPWLAYSAKDNVLYLAYDGVDAIHVAHSAPLVTPQAGLTLPFDVPAVPECLLGGNNPCSTSPIRQCVCPPGGIAVDQATGSVYLSYSKQNGGSNGGGVGVARSDDGGFTWSYFSVPGAGSSGSAFDTEWNFSPIKVDSAGTVYVAWGESQGVQQDSSGNDIATKGVAIRYSWSNDHGQTWHAPVTLSTSTKTNVFPTLDVVAPGVVDVAWYGSGATGDPNLVPDKATWNVVFTQVTGASSAPRFSPTTAVSNIHHGCIQAGGFGGCADRSLLDFFQLVVDHSGLANIVFTKGQLNPDPNALGPLTNLLFTRQTGSTTTTRKTHAQAATSPAGGGAARKGPRAVYRAIRSV